MNERIKELYDLADKFAKENRIQSIDAPGNNYFELFHEKFAELIVQECIDICLRNHIDNTETISAGECAYDIQEHFGDE